MESQAQAVETLLFQATGQAALDHAIHAVELYMAAASQARTNSEGARLRRKCQELIQVAERLKAGLTPQLSAEEAILRDASQLHGNSFPPWKKNPEEAEFQVKTSGKQFKDEATFSLSLTQEETFAGWKRPDELWNSDSSVKGDRNHESLEQDEESSLFETQTESCDLVQDVTTDCSVVAGLSAAIKILIGKHSVLSTIFFPYDHARGRPTRSASGKYVMRLNFNGCLRRVVVDDTLPSSLNERTLFVVDRHNPRLLWPALLEKAYLKVRGGYDFPGSNSGTDLWVLTGWIPEQIFLQREDLDINEVWSRIKAAHDAENVVITIGTGAISAEEEAATGLVGEHDYAIQSLADDGINRHLSVKNPWSNGPVWTGGWKSNSENATAAELKPTDPNSGHSDALWVTLEDVAQNFESMYLNWNPDLFACRHDHHFSWKMPPPHVASTLARNPQFSAVSPQGGLTWILISRHFQDAELEMAKKRADSMAAASRQLGFMSILVFDSKGKRVQVSGSETYRGPYVDSPQTLARLNMTAGKPYTVVLDHHELPLKKYTFTLSTFSHTPVQVDDAVEPMPHIKELSGAWTRRSAGGNASCSTYFINPQYCLRITEATPLSILLSTDNPDVYVHIGLVWGHGERVMTVREKDLASSSGDYRRGRTTTDMAYVEPGVYTLVCSTFDAGQKALFGLKVMSRTPVSLEAIPSEAAGRLSTTLNELQLSEGVDGMRAQLQAAWLTRVTASLRLRDKHGGQNGSLFVRLSVVRGWGPDKVTIVETGEGQFQNPATALRTGGFDIEPDRARQEGLWLVVEGMGQYHNTEPIICELSSDFPVQVGTWTPL